MWNIGPAHDQQWTVLDNLPTPTDQKVAPGQTDGNSDGNAARQKLTAAPAAGHLGQASGAVTLFLIELIKMRSPGADLAVVRDAALALGAVTTLHNLKAAPSARRRPGPDRRRPRGWEVRHWHRWR